MSFGALTIESLWDPHQILQQVRLPRTPPESLKPRDLLDAAHFLQSHLPPTATQTSTRNRVLTRIRQIPWGQTLTYGTIARECATSPRAVGSICASNPHLIAIPCHRVVSAENLGGYAAGPTWKSLILGTERFAL